MFVVDGFTAQESAVLLGKTSGAVRQNRSVARQRLRADLQRRDRQGSLERPARTGRVTDER